MQSDESHIADHELLQATDGELASGRASEVAAHLAACWLCRARKQELEKTVADFVRLHHSMGNPPREPGSGQRSLLKARLAQAAESAPRGWFPRPAWGYAAALALIAIAGAAYVSWTAGDWPAARPGIAIGAARPVPVSFPEPSLTPGAVATLNRDQICRAPRPNNAAVSAQLQRQVFEEYGIPTAEPRAYEVDYLITPALGGADDIRNLWPQSSTSTVWNARVKDALEERLHDLVCEGDLDLATAQREIASDWIAAYKKYFGTDRPIALAR
ncbi:MAG TPA: hypothetical protein VIY49_27875 [Bryobacteraceae bacterium]